LQHTHVHDIISDITHLLPIQFNLPQNGLDCRRLN
jgi:hypothetical protein